MSAASPVSASSGLDTTRLPLVIGSLSGRAIQNLNSSESAFQRPIAKKSIESQSPPPDETLLGITEFMASYQELNNRLQKIQSQARSLKATPLDFHFIKRMYEEKKLTPYLHQTRQTVLTFARQLDPTLRDPFSISIQSLSDCLPLFEIVETALKLFREIAALWDVDFAQPEIDKWALADTLSEMYYELITVFVQGKPPFALYPEHRSELQECATKLRGFLAKALELGIVTKLKAEAIPLFNEKPLPFHVSEEGTTTETLQGLKEWAQEVDKFFEAIAAALAAEEKFTLDTSPSDNLSAAIEALRPPFSDHLFKEIYTYHLHSPEDTDDRIRSAPHKKPRTRSEWGKAHAMDDIVILQRAAVIVWEELQESIPCLSYFSNYSKHLKN